MIAPGFCQCGCGGATKRSRKTITIRAIKKGDFLPFLPGHYSRVYPPGLIYNKPKGRPLTLHERRRHALTRVAKARQALLANPADVVLRLALQSRRDELAALQRVA